MKVHKYFKLVFLKRNCDLELIVFQLLNIFAIIGLILSLIKLIK